MISDVSVVDEAARKLIGIARSAARDKLGLVFMPAFDALYVYLRGNDVTGLGHNVAYYTDARMEGGEMHLDFVAGVQVDRDVAESGEIRMHATPVCRAATVAYFGDYSGLHEAHDAVQRWCRANGNSLGRNWEVYGDWEDDPAKRRTDVYYELTS